MIKNILILSLFGIILGGCSKEIFFGERGGPDAYVVGINQPLKYPQKNMAVNALPEPQKPQPKNLITRTKNASEVLNLDSASDTNHGGGTAYQSFLKNKDIRDKNVDFSEFDADMRNQYAKEKDNAVTPLDYITGRDGKLLDPITNDKKDSGISLF